MIEKLFRDYFVPVYCPGRACDTLEDVADILNGGYRMETKDHVARLGALGSLIILWDGGGILHCKVQTKGALPAGVSIVSQRPDETSALMDTPTPNVVVKPTKRGIRAEDLHLNIGPIRRLSTPYDRVEIDVRKIEEARRMHLGWKSTRSKLASLAAAAETLAYDQTNSGAHTTLSRVAKEMTEATEDQDARARDLGRFLFRMSSREMNAINA